MIIIMSTEGAVKVSDGRMIELIAHECCHTVDYIADRAGVKFCTESRAYTLDWLVGRTSQVVLPHLWAVKLLECCPMK